MLRSETAASPERTVAALAGLKAYQEAERGPARRPAPIAAEVGRAKLLDYGGDGPAVIFVPSLINPPTILDLAENNSLLCWLSAQGVHPYLVDWGAPTADEAKMTIGDHVEGLLLPLIDALGEPAHLVGYCLGGTMAAAAAMLRPPLSLVTIAAPWHFDGFPDDARGGLKQLWESSEPAARDLGALPMEVLQTGFWKLDPARTVSKFEMFGRLDPKSDKARAFVALEDWANDGPPLSYGAGRELVEDLFCGNATGCGQWTVGGRIIDPALLPCPVLDIISSTDRIVPEATAARAGKVITLSQGHVGMVVGRRGRTALWEPLAQWLSQVQHRS
ncbi:polyhydroxyalkanoate synthase [Parasphingopyxis lamellibrachiae]|uniref:Polyhydroxyalkanoate synthase n=1 Tax=Parasphingopyxis lamellibrachiae TaxID=680125 RepID=A0A3D9FBQ9_9SPHN|nr:polyhydroxyalkanoate synthase [Parasphingopyxis lamellibrachiae]